MNEYPPSSPGVPPPYPSEPPKTEGLATTSLVLGILSVTCVYCVGGIPAIICGHIARGRIAQSNGTLTGAGLALAGLIMGYLSIVISLLIAIGYVFLFARVAQEVPKFQSKSTPVVIDAQASQLASALQRYKADHGQLPAIAPGNGEVVDTATLVDILGGNNPRGVTYYQPGTNGVQVNGQPTDMWLQPLRIAIDLNGDGFVQVGTQRVTGIVAVWSTGPNQKDDLGTGDDITSWGQNVANPPLER